jgi:hypothetical protein
MSPLLDTLYARAGRRLRPDDWLVHTYTRERRGPGTTDPYGEQGNFTYGDPEPGIPCYYQDSFVQGFDTSGNPVVVNQERMLLKADDPLKRGDRVSQILDRRGGLVQEGPMFVHSAATATPFGPTLYVDALLTTEEGQG